MPDLTGNTFGELKQFVQVKHAGPNPFLSKITVFGNIANFFFMLAHTSQQICPRLIAFLLAQTYDHRGMVQTVLYTEVIVFVTILT